MGSFGITQSLNSWYGIAIIGLLAILSVYVIALSFIRYRFFRGMRIDSQKLLDKTHKAIVNGDTKELTELRGQRVSDPPVRILVGTAIANAALGPTELRDLFQVTRIRQRERLTKGLSVFGTTASIAPFLGLLGTVLGIVDAFQSLASTGASGPNVVASGVAAALWTTAAGLLVAIPAVIAYNFFKGKAKTILTEMEVVSQELLLLLRLEKVPKLKV